MIWKLSLLEQWPSRQRSMTFANLSDRVWYGSSHILSSPSIALVPLSISLSPSPNLSVERLSYNVRTSRDLFHEVDILVWPTSRLPGHRLLAYKLGRTGSRSSYRCLVSGIEEGQEEGLGHRLRLIRRTFRIRKANYLNDCHILGH